MKRNKQTKTKKKENKTMKTEKNTPAAPCGGMTCEEINRAHGWARGTAEMVLSRALKKMRARLATACRAAGDFDTAEILHALAAGGHKR